MKTRVNIFRTSKANESENGSGKVKFIVKKANKKRRMSKNKFTRSNRKKGKKTNKFQMIVCPSFFNDFKSITSNNIEYITHDEIIPVFETEEDTSSWQQSSLDNLLQFDNDFNSYNDSTTQFSFFEQNNEERNIIS